MANPLSADNCSGNYQVSFSKNCHIISFLKSMCLDVFRTFAKFFTFLSLSARFWFEQIGPYSKQFQFPFIFVRRGMFSHLFGRACERLGYFLLQLLWPGREAQQSTAFSLPIIKSCWIFYLCFELISVPSSTLLTLRLCDCGDCGSFFLFFCNGRALCACCCCYCLLRLFIYLFNCKRLWRFYEYDSHVPYTHSHSPMMQCIQIG